jgi:hypothetical protein
MYPHVGPYTPYVGFGNKDIGSFPIMWPSMSNPLANPITPPKPILGIAQIGIVIDHGEPSNDDDEYSERKHNPRRYKSFLQKNYTMNKKANHL